MIETSVRFNLWRSAQWYMEYFANRHKRLTTMAKFKQIHYKAQSGSAHIKVWGKSNLKISKQSHRQPSLFQPIVSYFGTFSSC